MNFTVTSSRINTGNCKFNALVRQKSGKAKVCKTFIHQFKSGRHLFKFRRMQRWFVGSADFLFWMDVGEKR